jgi:hypothetical protein
MKTYTFWVEIHVGRNKSYSKQRRWPALFKRCIIYHNSQAARYTNRTLHVTTYRSFPLSPTWPFPDQPIHSPLHVSPYMFATMVMTLPTRTDSTPSQAHCSKVRIIEAVCCSFPGNTGQPLGNGHIHCMGAMLPPDGKPSGIFRKRGPRPKSDTTSRSSLQVSASCLSPRQRLKPNARHLVMVGGNCPSGSFLPVRLPPRLQLEHL